MLAGSEKKDVPRSLICYVSSIILSSCSRQNPLNHGALTEHSRLPAGIIHARITRMPTHVTGRIGGRGVVGRASGDSHHLATGTAHLRRHCPAMIRRCPGPHRGTVRSRVGIGTRRGVGAGRFSIAGGLAFGAACNGCWEEEHKRRTSQRGVGRGRGEEWEEDGER